MKKYLLTLFLIVSMFPSIALASWWNPLSWFNNWKFNKENKIEEVINIEDKEKEVFKKEDNKDTLKPVEEINKLQKEIEELKKQKNNNSSSGVNNQNRNTIQNTKEEPAKTTVSNPEKSTSLQIINIKDRAKKGVVTVTWNTNLPSESRLLLTDSKKVYESQNGLGTDHYIEILDPVPSKTYDYMISATTDDKKGYDDFYDSFTSFVEYVVSLGGLNDSGCQIIKLKDSVGNIIKGKQITIKGTYKRSSDGTNYISPKPTINKKTDLNGEIKYCEEANIYDITVDNMTTTISSSSSNLLKKSIPSSSTFTISA